MCQVKGTAFITGAASGIGRATAHTLAKNGITGLALFDTNHELLLEVHRELLSQYPEVDITIAELDVRDETSVNQAIDSAAERFGRIDIGVNAAGISGAATRSHELALSDWQKVIDVNQKGLWLCQRAFIRQMLKQEPRGVREGRGVIVNVAAKFGVAAPPREFSVVAYTASKHAVVGITRVDSKAYAKDGIRINAVCPGYVDTPMTHEAIQAGIIGEQAKSISMGRFGMVEEIADSILFLASPMSSYMCGETLVVDGGLAI
ncbi:SDR family NAD(P)-dependent oxidoreductase [Aspergillus clavatus NRRL 1]|uniref:Short chain dehydrogenase/reductase family oxidoreductase, putative n=1 Tax=Aspergillus clavatus (strain ATCC 1007 / CBS 513.65 / DSM 816 / NCTC 3887 / NRRL 1 / QM 1276 / 107) TaxID=344612 RepID=A1CC09_ASPCL|nr:short chain dehydrogenase/reductase family oxidoreductase, putative [Aspergillus clavatus NRRL 1]EAW13277.1 short chain dehydrogenase/reductase family oxidoreductase, putative [Aspergillus clavatus NRRL 1]